MDAAPEQVDNAAHVNPPASGATHVDLRGTRIENRNLPTGRSRTQTQRSGEDVRHTHDFANEEEDPYWIEHDRLEQERRAQHQAQQEEMTKLRAQMERAVSDLKMVQSQVHRVTSRAPEIECVLEEAQNTPFTERISKTKFTDPGKIKIQPYEGKTDPKDHLLSFKVALDRANFNEEEREAGYCKLFVEHLKGPALQWFYRLEKNSIDNFRQLSGMFVQHYGIFLERKIFDGDLWNIRQEENESLRNFMEKFKTVLSKVEGISNASALDALRRSLLCPSPFRQEMTVNAPSTIQDALHRSTDFA